MKCESPLRLLKLVGSLKVQILHKYDIHTSLLATFVFIHYLDLIYFYILDITFIFIEQVCVSVTSC